MTARHGSCMGVMAGLVFVAVSVYQIGSAGLYQYSRAYLSAGEVSSWCSRRASISLAFGAVRNGGRHRCTASEGLMLGLWASSSGSPGGAAARSLGPVSTPRWLDALAVAGPPERPRDTGQPLELAVTCRALRYALGQSEFGQQELPAPKQSFWLALPSLCSPR